MNRHELDHLINYIIKCNNFQNILWGSIKNDMNIKYLKMLILNKVI